MKRKRTENGEEEIDDGQQPCSSKVGNDGMNQAKRTNKGGGDEEDGNEKKVTKEQTVSFFSQFFLVDFVFVILFRKKVETYKIIKNFLVKCAVVLC